MCVQNEGTVEIFSSLYGLKLRNHWTVQFCFVIKLGNRWTVHFRLCAKIKKSLNSSVLFKCKVLRNRWTDQLSLDENVKDPLDCSFLFCAQTKEPLFRRLK
jgi:hypothetical protein